MIKMIKNRKSEYLVLLGTGIIAFLLLLIPQLFETKAGSYEEMSTIGFILMPSCLNFFIAPMSINQEFNLAIGMGRTRKKFIQSIILVEILKNLFIMITAYVSHLIQKNIFNGKIEKTGLENIFKAEYAAVFVIGVSAIIVFFSAMILKFEKKALWTLWAIYMLICLMPDKISKAFEKNNNSIAAKGIKYIINIAVKITKYEWFGIGGMLILVLLCISSVIIMNQSVKN